MKIILTADNKKVKAYPSHRVYTEKFTKGRTTTFRKHLVNTRGKWLGWIAVTDSFGMKRTKKRPIGLYGKKARP